jgi:endonuclease III-like uncharacterized protein
MENREKKEMYVEPKIIATYTKEELEETIKPHGFTITNGYLNQSF